MTPAPAPVTAREAQDTRGAQDRLTSLFDERARLVAESGKDADPVTTLVVLRSLDVHDLVHGVRAFAADLSAAEGRAWMGSWTRTRFLFGNPVNLTGRARARTVAPAGSAAWLGPCPAQHPPGVSRLLKPLTGSLPPLPAVLDIPGRAAGPPRELQLATGGLTLVGYLVHLHHTLAEAALLGRLGPGEPLRITHRLELDAHRAPGGPGYARVHHAADDSPALRLYASLAP
ncbi:DUF6182 family protein [Streptomyces sp. NPDC048191]|uniref:DUF6182 family protein n=1 Tax=Streptomyces sp. NPDC048191 TaxID=3155484 RepID=UPI0033E942FF